MLDRLAELCALTALEGLKKPSSVVVRKPAAPPELTEGELLVRAKAGDREAMAKLFTKFTPLLWKLARKYGEGEVDERFQVASVGFLQAVQNFKVGKSKFFTYLFLSIKGYLLGAFRHEVTRGQVSFDAPVSAEAETTLIENTPSPDPGQEERLGELQAKRENATRIESVLSTLLPVERQIVEQRVMGDERVTLDKIAGQNGYSREWVRQMEVRALKKVTARLGEDWR